MTTLPPKVYSDKLRMFNSVMQTAIAAGVIGMGAMLVGLRDDNLIIKTEMEFLIKSVASLSAAQYTSDQALSDWRFQESINEELRKSVKALAKAEAKDLRHVSNRIDRLHSQAKK